MILLDALRLCLALATVYPSIPAERSCRAAASIVHHAGHHDPALLAAIFVAESSFDPWRVNPTSGACGVGQVLYSKDRATQARRCRAITGRLDAGVRAAVQKFDDAADYCRRRRVVLPCAIAGYQAGVPGVRAFDRRSPRRRAAVGAVLGRAARLRRAMAIHTTEAT